ncbi:MAG TPA: histidinol-phosphate transaminase [Prolixibacteraceae bacterium]|nr:histidinol-phosphate transaminase [Prolixibacteraceae bacterium]
MIKAHEYLNEIESYKPGKAKIQGAGREFIKLSSNENALKSSKKALAAYKNHANEVFRYADGSCALLHKALANKHKIDAEKIVCGAGSDELLALLTQAFAGIDDEIIYSKHGFLMYPISAKRVGARAIAVAEKNLKADIDAILVAITDKTKIIFIANPNNPTGTYVTHDHVLRFLDRVPKHVIVCFDEAYFDFVEATDFPRTLEWVREKRKNIILMRTFSKSYGLAGLRIGYGMGAPDVMEYLHKIRQPFNVNAIAQAAATAALDDRFFLWRTKHMVSQGRKFFYRRLPKLGVEYVPSQGNFILMNTGRPANELFQALLRKGVIIRSMKAYGLDTWIRVTIGRRSQNAHFYRVLKNFLTQGF